MRRLLAKTNNIAKRIFSLALAIMMMSSVVQAMPEGSLTAHAASGNTNIKIYFDNSAWGWSTPALQYWGGTNTVVSGYGTGPTEITGWNGATGYTLTAESDNWYSITLQGDFTGFQFLDMSNPSYNTGGAGYNSYMSQYAGETAQSLYYKPDSGKWYTDSACSTELSAPADATAYNIKVHYYNGTNNWSYVSAKIAEGESWSAIAGYESYNSWPGVNLTENAEHDNWYSIEVTKYTTDKLYCIFNSSDGTNQTGLSQTANIGVDITGTNLEYWYYNNELLATAPEIWSNPNADSGSGTAPDTPTTPASGTHVKVYFDNSAWGWNAPALQYWGGANTVVSGYGAGPTEITGWNGATGYTLTAESDNWYSIILQGDFTGFQFLDMSNPNNNTGGKGYDSKMAQYNGGVAQSLYYKPAADKWYTDFACTTELASPYDFTEQTIIMHFQKPDAWTGVSVKATEGSSWTSIAEYGYCNTWPGVEVEADPDNTGWYSFKVTMGLNQFNCIFTNGDSSSTMQTENICFTPSTEFTEKWVTLTDASASPAPMVIADTAPVGWVTNTKEINPPVNPYADAEYDSPVVNEDGSITFNLDKGELTSAEVMGTVPSCSWTIGYGFEMEAQDDLYTYTTEAGIAPGQYAYKFVTNGSNWITDPLCDLTLDGNSAVVVPGLSNGEVAPEKGIETDLPATLNLYSEGTLDIATPAVTYSLDDATLADVVTIDNENHKITVAKTCTETEFTLTATDGTNTSKMYVKPQDKIYTYTIYYYDFTAEHMDAAATDLWVWANDSASITNPASFSGLETLSDGNGWLKAEVKTPSTDIGFIARSFGGWTWQTADYTYVNKDKEENVTLYIVNGDATVYTSLPEVTEPRERYILVAYNRINDDYTDETAGSGWNFYSWNTGFGSETEIYTELMNGEQIMKAPVKDSIADFILAFIIRNSEKAADGNKWLDKDGGDTFTTFPADQEVVKIYFEQGSGVVKTLPYNKSYEIDGATDTITFYYRDDAALASTNSAKLSETVKVVVDGTEYEMTYDAENERYYYALTGCTSKDYTFYYLVGTEVVEDKFDSNGVVTYKSFEDLTITASLSQSSMDYNDNNVLKVEFAGADAELVTKEEIASITADLSQLGLSASFPIAPELMEGTIAVSRGVSGQKEIGITLKDIYGNSYTTSVSVNVTARDADSFDWDEAVIYMTCTDRFFDGNTGNNEGVDKEYSLGYHGGDFAGLTAKMDYLKELGVNTIWITPIVQNSNTDSDNGYHGYWASDFTKLSSYLGTEAEFKALLDAAHSRGMKIMVDVVLNHSGYDVEDYFNNIIPGTTMIRDSANTITGDDIYSSLSGLPDFMTEDPVVRDQLVEWQVDWIKKFDIDYYRVDTVKHVNTLTWQAFKNELTKVNPDFKMIGEYYGAGYASTGGALGTGTMDSLLDFDINDKARDFVTGSISSVESFYSSRNNCLNNTATMGGFLSSHDEDSFVDILINEKSKTEEEAMALAKVAAALQITAKGQVVIYYGEEIGQHGLNNWPIQSNRNDFNWAEADAQNGVAGSMLTHYQKLLNVRNTYSDVIAIGSRTTIDANDAAGYDVFKRSLGSEELYVALNIKNEAQTVSFATGAANGTVYKDLYNGGTYAVTSGTVTVTIPAAQDGGTVILVKSHYNAPTIIPSSGGGSSSGSSDNNSESGSTQLKPGTEVLPVEPTVEFIKATIGTLRPVVDRKEETEEEFIVKIESEVESVVPDTVTEVMPVVNMKLQLAVKEEVMQILDAIRNHSLGEGILDEETLENVKEALENNESIVTEIIANKLEKSAIDVEIKSAFEDALAKESEGKGNVESQIVQFMDLSLLLKTGEDNTLGTINKLSKSVTFTFTIPNKLREGNKEFAVLRMHDNKVSVLETTRNTEDTVSFETDCFSIYALAYMDVPVEEIIEEETVADVVTSDAMEFTQESDSNVALFVIIGVIGVAVVLLAFFLYKKNQKKDN